MYEAYWELAESPFDNSPNPKFFYLSPDHEEARMDENPCGRGPSREDQAYGPSRQSVLG